MMMDIAMLSNKNQNFQNLRNLRQFSKLEEDSLRFRFLRESETKTETSPETKVSIRFRFWFRFLSKSETRDYLILYLGRGKSFASFASFVF